MANVVTFIEKENEALIYDGKKLEDWHKTINKLKLEGQKTLASGDDKSPIPFRYLNSGEVNVIKEICPTTTLVEQYDKTAIPLEILSLIALAQKEKYFKEIEVWFNENDKDPFVVGKTEKSSYSYNYYVIGCWGQEKKFSWATLKKQAHTSYVARRKAKLNEHKEQITLDLKNLNSIADKHLRGEWIRESYSG